MVRNTGSGHRIGAIKQGRPSPWRPRLEPPQPQAEGLAGFDLLGALAWQHQPRGGASVVTRSWSRSGSKPTQREHPFARPPGSWGAALDRARRAWVELAGGPPDGRYSDVAAAAILRTALGLWPDVAAGMAEGDPPE